MKSPGESSPIILYFDLYKPRIFDPQTTQPLLRQRLTYMGTQNQITLFIFFVEKVGKLPTSLLKAKLQMQMGRLILPFSRHTLIIKKHLNTLPLHL